MPKARPKTVIAEQAATTVRRLEEVRGFTLNYYVPADLQATPEPPNQAIVVHIRPALQGGGRVNLFGNWNEPRN